MEIWSRAHGARHVGPPTSHGIGISHLTWSADGRYLAWYQDTGANGGEVVSVNTASGSTHTWPQKFAPSGLAVSGTNIYTTDNSTPFLVRTGPDGATHPFALPARAALTAPTPKGLVFASASDYPFTTQLWSLDLKGQTKQIVTLTALRHPNLALYNQMAAGDGIAALEEGDHQDVCGLGGTALLHTVNLSSGTQHLSTIPGDPKAKWRLLAMHFGAAGKGLVFGAYDAQQCGSAEASSASIVHFPTALFELPAPGLPVRRLASNASAGQRGPSGQLAEITGTKAMTYTPAEPVLTRDGHVGALVSGKPIPSPGTPYDLLWAPSPTR
ncbi:hypothetical protein [Streptomyces sp. NPDC057403]|uniref:hypothetical protein n=1 Tax=Streptomyces sp. NPDC057403 TaxID=3346119 RepID=UPI00367D73E9